MRTLLLISATLCVGVSDAQYWGVIAGVEQATWNDIVVQGHTAKPAELVGPGWFVGGLWAPEDSAIHFRLEVCWEHQKWEQKFEQYLSGGSSISRVRRGGMTRTLEIARIAPRVIFPLGANVNLIAGPSLGFIVAARTTETASTQSTSDWHSPSSPGGSYYTATDTSYTSTAGLSPYAALELGLEARVWKGLSLGAVLGVYSTFVGTSRAEKDPPPLCARFGLLWRL